MKAEIIDTTLRDGEQRAGIALGIHEKVAVALLLNDLGVYQIEAGIPAMGGIEKKSIEKILGLGLNCKVSVWNRMVVKDIEQSLECGAKDIHISVPTSDIQMRSKLNKDRSWVLDTMRECIYFAKGKGACVSIGMEDASRADFSFLLDVVSTAAQEGAERVRYADTVGILFRQRIRDEMEKIREVHPIPLEMHAHNDLGMAVANSIAAAEAGAGFVDCTIGGLGERAGNCNYIQFLTAAKECLKGFETVDLGKAGEIEKEILRIIYDK